MPYYSPTLPPGEEMGKLVQFCTSNYIPLIIGCDLNSHHLVWGSSDIKLSGEALLDYLTGIDPVIANNGVEPNFVTANRQEDLDLTQCSLEMLDLIANWKVTKDISSSEHRSMYYDFRIDPNSLTSIRTRKSTNWVKF